MPGQFDERVIWGARADADVYVFSDYQDFASIWTFQVNNLFQVIRAFHILSRSRRLNQNIFRTKSGVDGGSRMDTLSWRGHVQMG